MLDRRRQRGVVPVPILAGAAVAVVVAGLSAWALLERARHQSCLAENARLEAQVVILGRSIQEQNDAVRRLGEASAGVARDVKRLAAEARRQRETGQATIDRIEKAATARVRPDGSAKDCGDAREEIRKARGGTP